MKPENGVAIAQRLRKRSKVVVKANMKEQPESKKRKKAGSLRELPNMPLDILFEIFGHLPPYDLLKLARTSKAIRRLLLNKSSIITWKTALNHVPDLPPCPPEMSEPAWTNLAFSPHCHFCLTYTRNVFWFLRIRSCMHCAQINLENTNHLLCQLDWIPKHHLQHFFKLVPSEPRKSLSNPKSLLELRAKYLAVAEDDRGHFLKEQMGIFEERYAHGELCEYWANTQAANRELELRHLRADGLLHNSVVSKLEELGWGDVIRALPLGALANHKLVDRPQRLTEKIWHNIKDEVLEFMEDMRTLCLERELEKVVLQRKRPAVEFLKVFKKSKIHDGQLMPDGPDFCNFEPVKEILCQPLGVDVDVSSFNVLLSQLPATLARWRKELHESLLSLLPLSRKLTALEHSRRLELATTVFQCDDCINTDVYFTSPPLLFYPQVLGHRCLTYKLEFWAFEPALSDSVNLLPGLDGFLLRKRWSANCLGMEPMAHKIAKEFVALAGLSPSTATVNDMDQLDLRFVCWICQNVPKKGRREKSKAIVSLWTWRAVIKHHYDHYSATSLDGISEWYEVIRELPEAVKYEELTNQEAGLAIWSCFHCSDTASETRASLLQTKVHLAEFHDIELPTINEDYFKVFAAKDIETSQPPFRVCWDEGSISFVPEELDDNIKSSNKSWYL